MTAIEADGVFQGGGVKGIAIGGALKEFSEHPRLSVSRWMNVAGTSAGAVIAAYLAAGRSGEELAETMERTPFASFQDFGGGGPVLGGAWNLMRHRGLARGEAFRKWFDDEVGGLEFGSLRAEARDGAEPEYRWTLRMIAADVTHRKMLVLPDDLSEYRLPGARSVIDPDRFKVADAVRMSMSIPYFFAPVQLVREETGGTAWIVDGGILSNFPVWLFDVRMRKPLRPTFGLKLEGGRGVGRGLETFVRRLGWTTRLALDLFDTTTSAWDDRLQSQSTVVRTCTVSADDVGTTDFDLAPERRRLLTENGRTAAAEFLEKFDLRQYRNTFGLGLAEQPAGSPT